MFDYPRRGIRYSFLPAWAAFAQLEESKVVSFHSFMVNPKSVNRSFALAWLLALFFVSTAHAQSFTLTPTQLHPASVDAGESATATIAVTGSGGFTGAVDFTCTITSNQVTTNPPGCLISPDSVMPGATGAQVSVTVTTTGATPAGTYQITVTGTSGSLAPVTAVLYLNVADLTEDYTITVLPATAVPSPVIAGNIATTTVTVSPLGSYTGSVTLSCLSVTPVVTGAPVCSFTPATVNVTSGVPPTSTLTLTTFGTTNTTTAKASALHMFFALWLAIPGLALIGFGARGNQRTRFIGILMLVAIASGLILLPACSNSSTSNTTGTQITPNDTYTFTLSGADVNGAGPSSTTTATVMLQVTSQ